MPNMDWGLNEGTIQDFDRSKIFVPYAGPTPPTGVVYMFELKSLKLVKGVDGKLPQLRAGLELIPRTAEEKLYEGFYRSTFSPVANNTAFRFVPFLDVLGISEREFRRGTKYKEDGSIYQIGTWRWEEGILVLARLEAAADNDGNTRININDTWFGTPTESDLANMDDDDNGDDDESEVDDDDEEF